MSLKIISNNDNVQEDKAIDYPCLMESIDPSCPDNVCIVLALGVYVGIAMVDICPEADNRVGEIKDDWYPFSDKTKWKPYDKPVTFCNA